MKQASKKTQFQARLLRPLKAGSDTPWTFVILPREVSEQLPRRGRTSVAGTLNGASFSATLEPDGQLSHWLRVSEELRAASGAQVGDLVALEIAPVAEEPEPDIPPDFLAALNANPAAHAEWESTTTIARLDWIHWITSSKQLKTRTQRISNACDMLSSGKRRVCCFDPSGFYSKAFSAPQAAE